MYKCIMCPLNDHLYSLTHEAEQPDCACGQIREHNKQFLPDCLLCSNEWNQMIIELNRLSFESLLNNLLYIEMICTLRKQTKKHF